MQYSEQAKPLDPHHPQPLQYRYPNHAHYCCELVYRVCYIEILHEETAQQVTSDEICLISTVTLKCISNVFLLHSNV